MRCIICNKQFFHGSAFGYLKDNFGEEWKREWIILDEAYAKMRHKIKENKEHKFYFKWPVDVREILEEIK